MKNYLTTITFNYIKNLFNQNNISFQEEEYAINTNVISISEEAIISQLTGEILVKFGNTFTLSDFVEYLLPLISSHYAENQKYMEG